jgi:fucose permease
MKLFSRIRHYPRLGLILLAYLAFISLGLPDGLLGVGWPSIRTSFSQPLDALGLLLVAATSGYLTSSFLNGKLIAHLGVGGLLAASCALTGAGLIGYTLVPVWWMMVVLGVFVGLGAGAVDAGLNTYVASNFGEGLMQWLHASYGIGVTFGPIIMTGALNFFDSWRLGYRIVGIAQLALAASFLFTLRMWQSRDGHAASADQPPKLTDYKTPYLETLRQPRVWLSLLLFFLYTGAEAGLGAWAYTLLTESRSVPTAVAGLWAGSYWASFTIGRVLAGLYTKRIGLHKLVWGSFLTALLGAALLWWNPFNPVGIFGVVLIGFAIAPIFPGLVSGTSDRVGARFAANTIGMQMGAAGLGAASIPALMGVLARYISLEIIPLCLFVLFLLQVVMYALSLRPGQSVLPIHVRGS